jgi:hypothetical protein
MYIYVCIYINIYVYINIDINTYAYMHTYLGVVVDKHLMRVSLLPRMGGYGGFRAGRERRRAARAAASLHLGLGEWVSE